MNSLNFKPIHRFFHGDPIDGEPAMYSMSIGDTWLYFYRNVLVGISHLVVSDHEKDELHILNDAPDAVKQALANELPQSLITYNDVDDLVGHALRLASKEISDLVQQRLLPNQGE